jgi:hypothetical protein
MGYAFSFTITVYFILISLYLAVTCIMYPYCTVPLEGHSLPLNHHSSFGDNQLKSYSFLPTLDMFPRLLETNKTDLWWIISSWSILPLLYGFQAVQTHSSGGIKLWFRRLRKGFYSHNRKPTLLLVFVWGVVYMSFPF